MSETIPTTTTVTEDTADGGKKPVSWGVVAIWVAVIGLLAVLGWRLQDVQVERPEIGSPAPEFGMEFFNGYTWEDRTVADLGDMQGKVVVLNFWASWCVECRYEADFLEQASRMYQDDVIFLGIAYVDVEPESIKYLEEFNITYPNAPDLGTRISRDYEITGVPETFIIDQKGEIVDVVIGPVSEARLIGTLDSLIADGG